MPILKMIVQNFGFLVSEANDWRSRDQVEIDADGEQGTYLNAGSLLVAGATAADPMVEWDGVATTVGGILATNVSLDTGLVARATAITRQAEVKGRDLLLNGEPLTDAQLATATSALRELGIIVRTNEGLFIGNLPEQGV